MPKLKTVFAGSPEFAAVILARLADSNYRPAGVFTQPDRPRGRGRKVQPNPVKKLALELDIPALQPASLRKPEAVEALTSFHPDVFIVAAYGLILPAEILAVPTYGCINVHASLLPRWRGAAPIERAMMAGDTETGVCIMKMETGLDTGPVYARDSVPIPDDANAADLEATLAATGAKALLRVLSDFKKAKNGKQTAPVPEPQDSEHATYADKLSALDRKVNWQQSAAQVARQIMALSPRLPVRVEINHSAVQLLRASSIQQSLPQDDHIRPGTLIDVSKNGFLVQCATDLLQITSLKVEQGKGKVLDPAAAINGFSELFYPGALIV